jgi:signal transduction histidine kinase
MAEPIVQTAGRAIVPKANILLVDDQPAKLLSYEVMLAELGENLIRATSAREALGCLLRDEIAVVLMDVSMPELDGFELASMIREHPRCERTAIIFVSAIHLSDFDRMKGYETGAVDYVSVPVVPELLRAKVRVFVDLYRKTTELKRLNEELEERVRARTEELERSLARLQDSETRMRQQGELLAEADRRKDEFLAMLAHELRNPLAPIRNAVEIMRRSGPSGSGRPVDIDWIRKIIDRQVSHLVRLVDDLLDASRIGRGKLVLERARLDLRNLVSEAIESVGASQGAAAHEIVVTLPGEPVQVNADAVRMTQVVLNLLHNAMKFTPRGGRIDVTLLAEPQWTELRVRDTGQGMDKAELAQIFDMFYQGRNAAGFGKSGLGIGLTLVHRLVQMHGGSVTAQSEGQGKGSCFTVRMPRLSEAGVPAAPKAYDALANAGKVLESLSSNSTHRVLIVDDNHDVADSLAGALRLAGNEVDCAFDGSEALEAVTRFAPQIILMDIGMPVLDGYAAARAIRQEPSGKSIFLVAMTGWGQAEDRRRALEAGFDAHLVKPATLDALLELIESRQLPTHASSAPIASGAQIQAQVAAGASRGAPPT